MRRAVDVLLADLDEIADLLTNEQGKPRVESYTMELLPDVDSLKWIADNGPKILADEKLSMPHLPEVEEGQVHLRADRRGRRHRALELPLVDPLRRGRDRADGRQRRRAQAGQPDAADRRSDPEPFEKAGFPEGLVRTVHGGGRIGDALVKSTAGKIFFTGSVEVGRKVGVELRQAA